MTKTEIAITGIFTIWLTTCILYVIFNSRIAKYVNRWDMFRLISTYQLFSETSRNYKLFYHDKLVNNTETEWNEVSLTIDYKWYHVIWFPEALVLCTLISTVDDLVTFVKKNQNTPAIVNVSERLIYQTILRYIYRFPANKFSAERQFKIEETGGFTEEQTPLYVFVSKFHQR